MENRAAHPTKNCQEYPLLGREYSHGSLEDLTKLVVFFGSQRAHAVGSDFFTIHKMFQKKNNKQPLYSSLSLIELAIFLRFPLAYSSDIANVSTGVRLESWQRSGEKRTLPHPPSSTDTIPLLLSLQLSCNKSSGKACYADYFASNGDFIS